MVKETFSRVGSIVNSVASINGIISEIEAAFDNTLSRDGSSPNQMEANLDMNGHRILNLPAAQVGTEPARISDVMGLLASVEGTPIPEGSIPIAALATDPLDASNLNAGIVPDARMPNLTGDVTTAEGAVATTISANAVTTGKINDLAVTTAKIDNLAVTTGKIADDAVTQAKLGDAAVGWLQLADNAVTDQKILDGTISPEKLAQKPTLGTLTAMTSGAAKEIFIPAWVTSFTISLSTVSLSGAALIRIQLGGAGVVETSGYSTVSSVISSGAASSAQTVGFDLYTNVPAAANSYTGSITFTCMDPTRLVWVGSGVFNADNAAWTTTVSGIKALSNALDRFRISSSDGSSTFDAGWMNVRYS